MCSAVKTTLKQNQVRFSYWRSLTQCKCSRFILNSLTKNWILITFCSVWTFPKNLSLSTQIIKWSSEVYSLQVRLK